MSPITIAERWIAAFNAHDLEALLALYHQEAEHFSPKLKARRPESQGWVRGKDLLRAWWRDAFERLPGLRYEVTDRIADEGSVFLEYLRHVPGEEVLRVGEVLVVRDGLIVASRVYHG